MKYALLITALLLAACGPTKPVSDPTVKILTHRKQVILERVPGEYNLDIRFFEVCIEGVTYFASQTEKQLYVIGGPKVAEEGKPVLCK